jgi:hypothetical protein
LQVRNTPLQKLQQPILGDAAANGEEPTIAFAVVAGVPPKVLRIAADTAATTGLQAVRNEPEISACARAEFEAC